MIKNCMLMLVRVVLAVLCAIPAVGSSAHAGMLLSLEVREYYDDNVIGLTADNRAGAAGPYQGGMNGQTAAALKGGLDGIPGPGGTGMGGGSGSGPGGGGTGTTEKKGDFSTNLYANIGYEYDLGARTTTYLEASVDHTRFSTYTDFDFTVGTAGAGAVWRLSDVFSVRAAAHGSVKNFANDLRDGTAYGAGIGLRERISPSFWSKQFFDIEQNDADSPDYSYLGQAAGISAGYAMTDASTLGIGYTYFLRDYRDIAPAVTVTSQLAFLDVTMDLSSSWSVSLGYEHEWADSNIPGTATTNNRYRVGLRYEY